VTCSVSEQKTICTATMETIEPSQLDGHVENAKLCATCHNLDFEKAKPIVIFQAWGLCLTYAALLTAQTRGCAFCDILASIFEQLWQGSRRKLEDANPSVTVSVPTREIDNLAASFDSPTPRPFYAGVEEQCIDLVLTVPQKCKLMRRKASLMPSYANTGQTTHCRFGPCG
jgi:hypothetical protein